MGGLHSFQKVLSLSRIWSGTWVVWYSHLLFVEQAKTKLFTWHSIGQLIQVASAEV